MSYYLAPSLVQLRNEVNKRWPNRSKVSDGWIGDTAHSARVSDHNPDYKNGGVVRALDITVKGIDVNLLLKHTTNDSRVSYVIYNRRIYQHSTGWKPYSGSNPHTSHVHVSIAHKPTAEKDTKLWFGSASAPSTPVDKPTTAPTPPSSPTVGEWPKFALVVDGKFQSLTKRAYQRLLAPASVGNYTGKIDADFGSMTVKAEQRWLKKIGFYSGVVDGQRGPMTIKALQSFLKSKKLYSGLIDGDFGPMTVKSLQNYLNSQRKYY